MGRDYIPPPVPRPIDACGQAKCAYCGRYGALGSCLGCGAPNKPIHLTDQKPLRTRERIDVTVFGDAKHKYVDGLEY